MQRNPLAVLLAGLCASSTPACAEPIYQLEDIVVTATRTARTADASLASVSVITRKDIDRSQARSVPELLEGLAGITLSNNGGPGKATSVFLRGTESGHVVVLIDGVKIGSATTGVAAFQDLPLGLIDRIEVVRGPASALYGSEAIGGVIQIFTRKRTGAPLVTARTGYGTYNTRDADVGIAGGGASGWYSLGASHFATDGFNAMDGAESDDDGYRNNALNLRGGLRLTDHVDLELSALTADTKVEYDGDFQNEGRGRQQSLGAKLDWRVTDRWQARFSLGQGRDESRNYKDGVFQSRFDSLRDSAAWQNDLTLAPDHLLTLGLEHLKDTVGGTTTYTETSRTSEGLYVQYQGRLEGHDLRLALRRDDIQRFGDRVTGSLGWGLDLGDGLRVTASYGSGFKAPTFNELYYPGFGNPDLKPERSRSLEAGLSGRLAGGSWSARAFKTDIDDLVGYDATWTPRNIDRARLRGIETSLKTRLSGWNARLDVTLQDPENRSATFYGKVLNRRAERSLRLDLDRDFGAWTLGATLRAEGRRYDDLANTVKLPGYGLADLRGSYRLAKDWTLDGKIANLFGKEYETAATYNQPGRGVYLTLRYQP